MNVFGLKVQALMKHKRSPTSDSRSMTKFHNNFFFFSFLKKSQVSLYYSTHTSVRIEVKVLNEKIKQVLRIH